MKIENNKLVGAPYRETSNKRGLIHPVYIVIHYDGASNGTSAIDWMLDPKSGVSAHLHISRTGKITQLAEFNARCWHAGRSSWKGLSDLNSCSIGIEMQNTGVQDYTDEQIDAAADACRAITSCYPIKEIIGHSDIAPGRKIDPGKQFPWAKFRALVKEGF